MSEEIEHPKPVDRDPENPVEDTPAPPRTKDSPPAEYDEGPQDEEGENGSASHPLVFTPVAEVLIPLSIAAVKRHAYNMRGPERERDSRLPPC